MKKKYQLPQKIIFTGGGTAGHVIPNLVLIKKFIQKNWRVYYIGSYNGIEKNIINKEIDIVTYYPIITGKLRRYLSLSNFIDPLKVLIGIIQSMFYLIKIKPNIIFSKGGYVSFPPVIAAWILHIPVIMHESDISIGLANRLCLYFAKKICISFPDTANTIKNINKIVFTGSPIRASLFKGNTINGKKIVGFTDNKKIILILGGSLGSKSINTKMRKFLPKILDKYNIIHICGKNNTDNNLQYLGYRQFEYLHDELCDIFAISDIIISRAGANIIYELIALRKPFILIPLPKNFSRGDQIDNAQYCTKKGFCFSISDEDLILEKLLKIIADTEKYSEIMVTNMKKFNYLHATQIIYDLVNNILDEKSDR